MTKERRDRSECFLCGSTENITKEHIPPKGIFLEPRPSDLITVPCCLKCNNSNSRDDELLRLFVSGAVNRNEQGHKLWADKVVPHTIERKRLKGEVREIVRTAKSAIVQTNTGPVKMPYMTVPQESIKPTLIRITKGLIWTLHPDIIYNDLKFDILQLDQFDLANSIGPTASIMKYGQRGNGAFRFWYSFLDDAPRCALWHLMFFDSIAFAVFQTTPDRHFSIESKG